jgi:hypothetical protein
MNATASTVAATGNSTRRFTELLSPRYASAAVDTTTFSTVERRATPKPKPYEHFVAASQMRSSAGCGRTTWLPLRLLPRRRLDIGVTHRACGFAAGAALFPVCRWDLFEDWFLHATLWSEKDKVMAGGAPANPATLEFAKERRGWK